MLRESSGALLTFTKVERIWSKLLAMQRDEP
jgi:hypothetical protein